jgi:hypothetical protein
MYKESSSGSSSTSIKDTKFGWFSFFMMAISSLMSSNALFSSPVECRCNGELKPMPAGRALRRALGRRRRFDCARLRNRDFENSLTACGPTHQHMSICHLGSDAHRLLGSLTTHSRSLRTCSRLVFSHIHCHTDPRQGGRHQTSRGLFLVSPDIG